METEIVAGYAYPEDVKRMVSQYTQMLVDNHPGFAEYLALQNHSEELDDLQAVYGLPTAGYSSRLLTAPRQGASH